MTERQVYNAHTTLGWNEVEEYIKNEENAFETDRQYPASRRVDLLRQIAREIDAHRADLIATSHRETHLPEGRLDGEIDRTINQLGLFTELLEDGSWVNAIIATATPQSLPDPKPDIRPLQLPISPVCVSSSR